MGEGEICPPPPKNPLTDGHQNLCRQSTSAISTNMPNFIQIGLGVSVLRMRNFAPLGTKWLGYFFGVLEKGYSLEALTDFVEKYVKGRGSAQGSTFWGSRNQNLRFWPPFSPQNRHFGPHFDGTIVSPKNGFNIGRLESKQPLIVVVA